HIESLSGDGMDHMRGVADERDALGDERTRDRKAERVGAARAFGFQFAEVQTEAPLELGMKLAIRQRHEAPRRARRLGPDDGGAPSLQRQNRKRAGGKKMLVGASAMV